MNREEEKKQLIEQIQTLKDERVIDAIKELMSFGKQGDDGGEKFILRETLEEYEKNPSPLKTIEEYKEELKAKGKL